jgi:E3 ubiquitin-protein ligase HECTD1
MTCALSVSRFSGYLSKADLELVDPARGSFLRSLDELAERKKQILDDARLSVEEKRLKIANLTFVPPSSGGESEDKNKQEVSLDDLCLTFEYCPSSRTHDYLSHSLVPGGEEKDVTIENVEE